MSITMLDLFSGTGGASAAMKDRGWRVIHVDIEPDLRPDIVADVSKLPLRPFPVDLLWASPPCTYYSRWMQRASLYPGEPEPSHELYEVARRVIAEWQPRFWVIENVLGATYFWGKPDYSFGSRKLWTNLPILSQPVFKRIRKTSLGPFCPPHLRGAYRGRIPYAISEVVANAVEYLSSVAVP